MKPTNIKVVVTFTEGYQKRFTEACMEQLRKRKRIEKTEQVKEKTA